MVLYLAYVHPLQEYLSVLSNKAGWTDYVWGDQNGAWETDRLTRIIAQESQTRLKIRLTTHDYRHLAIAIGRVAVGPQFVYGYKDEIGEVEAAEVETDDPLEMSAGRGGEIGASRYGVQVDIVKHLSNRSISTFRPLSEKWHEYLGLNSHSDSRGQKHMRESSLADNNYTPRVGNSSGLISGWNSAVA